MHRLSYMLPKAKEIKRNSSLWCYGHNHMDRPYNNMLIIGRSCTT